MICPKCKQKYEDDMPKCLWCDFPNPKFGNSVQETAPTTEKVSEETSEAAVEDKIESRENKDSKGTLAFFLAMLFGGYGVHAFFTGKYLRGALYCVFCGVNINLSLTGIIDNPSKTFNLVSWGIACIVDVLVLIDLCKISWGKYKNQRTGVIYTGALWMKILFVLYVIFSIYSDTNSFIKIANTGNLYQDPYGKNIDTSLYETASNYILKQEAFFKKEHRIGKSQEIGFTSINTIYHVEDLDNGIIIRYLGLIKCKIQTTWAVIVHEEHNQLNWSLSLPDDASCNANTPKMRELKNTLEQNP